MHNFLTRILILILLFIALIVVCSQLNSYNVPLFIECRNYKINTSIGFALFFVFLLVTILFSISNFISSVFNKLQNYKVARYFSKRRNAVNLLIEAALSLCFNLEKSAVYLLKGVNPKFLNPEEVEYFHLLHNKLKPGDSNIENFYRLIHHPNLKYIAAQRLAKIEYKLGNIDKALTHSEMYYTFDPMNEDNNYILCSLLAKRGEWRQVNHMFNNFLANNNSVNKAPFAQIYIEEAKNLLSSEKQDAALDFCEKALLLDPSNNVIAELFCEIAVSVQKYELVNKVLLTAFRSNPNLSYFLLLKKFIDYDAEELYGLLMQGELENAYPELFMAIRAILKLPTEKLPTVATKTITYLAN